MYKIRTHKWTRTKPVFWPYKPVEMRTEIRTFSVLPDIGEINHFCWFLTSFGQNHDFGRKKSIFGGISQFYIENRDFLPFWADNVDVNG